jgi:hypothetical protein
MWCVQALFNSSYLDFWVAVGGRSRLPPAVLLILPPLPACPTAATAHPISETRAGGVAVTLTAAGPSQLVQHRGCGRPGHSLRYAVRSGPTAAATAGHRELMVLLARLLFGVFPEAGHERSARYPLFHETDDGVCFQTRIPSV